MADPEHHKEIVLFLKERCGGKTEVFAYRNNAGKNPVVVGSFGSGKNIVHSTIGISDQKFDIPGDNYELAVIGSNSWLPNVLASSTYWLKGRSCTEWPLVCEDVVRDNAKSTYRHVAYAPSPLVLTLESGREVRWLLGAPIKDSEICIELDALSTKIRARYPAWFSVCT